jgi:hypothetical protein
MMMPRKSGDGDMDFFDLVYASKWEIRHCEERSDEAIHSFVANGLLRGACHRARIRATRWLAMTTLCSVACRR